MVRGATILIAVSGVAGTALSCAGSGRAIDDEIALSGPGIVTIVEFVDYECRFCRETFAELTPLLEERGGRVRVVVKHVPLPKHATAREAAYAAVCAEAQGKLVPMHAALMEGAGHSEEELQQLASTLGVDLVAFSSCMRSDLPKRRVEQDTEEWRSLGADGLPMVFIQKTKFVGLQHRDALEDALVRAHRDAE